MAQPITWRNVNGNGAEAASRIMDTARTGITTGLAGLGNILDQNKQIRDANFRQVGENDTNSVMDALSQYQTVGDFEAAQANGAIDALRAQFSNADSAAVRTAVDARPATLMARANEAATFDKGNAVRTAEPLKQEYLRMKLSNDDAGADAFLLANQPAFDAAGFTGDLMETGLNRDRTELTQEREDRNDIQGQEAYLRDEAARVRGEAADALVSTATSDYFFQRKANEKTLTEMANSLGIGTTGDGEIDYDNATDAQVANLAAVAKSLGIDSPVSQTDVRQSVLATLRDDPSFKDMKPQEQIDAAARLDGMLVNANSLAQGDRDLAQSELASAARYYNIEGNGYIKERDMDKAELAVSAIMEVAQTNETLKDQLGNEDKQRVIIPAIRSALETGIPVRNPETGKIEPIPLTSADVKAALLQYGEKWGEINERNIKEILEDYAKSPSVAKRYQDSVEYTGIENSISNRLTQSANGQDNIEGMLSALRAAQRR